MLYSPNDLKTDPCPKGYRIPSVEEWRQLQSTLDNDFNLIESGGPLNFHSDFLCLTGGSFDAFSDSQKSFLVVNDYKDPQYNKYKFLYFPLELSQYTTKPLIGPDHRPEYVKCRCIRNN